MKSKTLYFPVTFNKFFQSIGIFIILLLQLEKIQAQKKFEIVMNLNSGYYFDENPVFSYKIENGLQFGIGSHLNYYLNQKTKIGLGINYNFIKLSENKYYFPARIMPDLNTLEIPFSLQRDIFGNLFVNAGASVYWHQGSYNPLDKALGKWEIGTGYRFKNLAVSVNYSQNFKTNQIRIETENSSSFGISKYQRKILNLKLEYALWKNK